MSDGLQIELPIDAPQSLQTVLINGVPDALFPTDNDWGVPSLDLAMQADALDLPVIQWERGGAKRLSGKIGTWHFYTEDTFFEGLWKNPAPLVNSRAPTIIEPNFSTNHQMPFAVFLWQIYRKRWLARYWQSQGIRVIVDVYVEQCWKDYWFLGVPSGWGAFATRYEHMQRTLLAYDFILQKFGETPHLFVVYGGGQEARELCQRRANDNWIWVNGSRDATIDVRRNNGG